MRSTPRKLVTPHTGPTTDELLKQVELALMELQVVADTMRMLAGSTKAQRISVDPQNLRNFFHFQHDRSAAALVAVRSVMYPGPPDNWCRAA